MRHHDCSSLLRHPPTLIDHGEALVEACTRWKCCEALALDTEFERSRTYYPRLGLIQACDGEAVYLIDPLALPRLDPFLEVLRERHVLKILHASSEDIEVFYHLGRTLPRPLFDTQIAAPFAGYGYAPGYQRLVNRTLSVEVTKAETRSNWLQRPLRRSQLIYAAEDVIYLLPLYRTLQRRLAEMGRDQWVREEIEKSLDPRRFDVTGDSISRRIPQAWELGPRSLEVLQRLCVWREEQARTRDLPRRFILHDAVLLEIARKHPTSSRVLKTIRGLPATVIAHYEDTLINVIRGALGVSKNELPPPLPNPAETREHTALLAKLKAVVLAKAAEISIPPQVLGHNRLLKLLLQCATAGTGQLPREFQGWRKDVIGDALLATLRQAGKDDPVT